MSKKEIGFVLNCLGLGSYTNSSAQKKNSIIDSYNSNCESLSKHNPKPERFREAKFGIYFHSSVYLMPAYVIMKFLLNMYINYSRAYKYLVKTYGSPLKF